MDLTKLFETQKILRDRIGYEGEDRLNKLILALSVELGELANELPLIFKFWSRSKRNNYKRALKEYVDGLHFILELGLEIDFDYDSWEIGPEQFHNPLEHFLGTYRSVIEFSEKSREMQYVDMLEIYLGLGEMLGFTWEQIEQAYFTKNKINHQRQEEGY